MDTPPLTGDKGGLQDANISDITSRRRHASGPTDAPDQESISTAPVTDSDLHHLHGDPASQANTVQDPRRSPATDYPLQFISETKHTHTVSLMVSLFETQ